LQLLVWAYAQEKVWGEGTVRPRWVEIGVRRRRLALAPCAVRCAKEVARAGGLRARGKAWIAVEATNGLVLSFG
jgi:hypothetical protein